VCRDDIPQLPASFGWLPAVREVRQGPVRLSSTAQFVWFYAVLLTLAHLVLCAAAIRLRPAADIVLFGFGACPLAP
jgi:hypothetical protein